jgi:hypothetical protein
MIKIFAATLGYMLGSLTNGALMALGGYYALRYIGVL